MRRWGRDRRRRPVPVSRRSRDPESSRALGRNRVSSGPQRDRHSDRRANPCGRRLLRCRHVGEAVSSSRHAGGGGPNPRAGFRKAFDPAIVKAFIDLLAKPDAAGRGALSQAPAGECRCERVIESRLRAPWASTLSRKSRSRTGRATRSMRSLTRWAGASASPRP